MSAELWPWAAMLLLGAVHGVNPGMGWLFAVALGLQEGSGRAVWRALPPLAIGHALAVAVAVLVAALVGLVLPMTVLRWVVGAALIALGAARLLRHRHPRWGGMRIGSRDLTIWSFLMASAHGAGLMIVPFALAVGRGGDHAVAAAAAQIAAAGHAHGRGHGQAHGQVADFAHAGGQAGSIAQPAGEVIDTASAGAGLIDGAALLGTLLHTAGYLLVTALIAVVIYEKVGLRFLRTAWINVDAIWAGALVLTGVLTLVI